MSDKYLFLKTAAKKEKNGDKDLDGFIVFCCDYFEKYLSIKCLFPLIEELKKSGFEKIIKRSSNLLKNQKELDDLNELAK